MLDAQASEETGIGRLDKAMYMVSEFDDIKISHEKRFVRARQIKQTKTIRWRHVAHNAADSFNAIRLRIRANS